MALFPVAPLETPGTHTRSAISDEKLKQLYTLMVSLRVHKLGAHKTHGQRQALLYSEACEAAAILDLQSRDTVSILPGQGIDQLARRAVSSSRRGPQSRVVPWRVIEGGDSDRLAIAAGVAFGNRLEDTTRVVIAFAVFGDAAHTSDSLRFAREQNLPIIYFEPTRANIRKSMLTLHQLPTIPVDDSDAVAVYRVVYESIDKARRGAGPTLIQCMRHESLSTRGHHKDERADPLVYMEKYLRKRNLWSDDLRSLGQPQSSIYR